MAEQDTVKVEVDAVVFEAMRAAIIGGITNSLSNAYNSPLAKVVAASIESQQTKFRTLLDSAVASCVDDPTFSDEISVAVRQQIARQLIQKFGGEVEKQVNALKSDPTTRARITLALEEIVQQKDKQAGPQCQKCGELEHYCVCPGGFTR